MTESDRISGGLVTETTSQPEVEVEGWGEDGRYAIARGHVDPDAFLNAVAKELLIDLADLAVEEVEHRWWRPSTPADYDGMSAEDLDGWMTWGGVTAAEGEPITVLDLES